MYYAENHDKAGEYLRLALAHITRYKLPANPVNYAVWYEYVSGKNHHLKQAIDYSLKNGKPINVTTVKRLYKAYIADGDRMITEKLLKKVTGILSEISMYIIETRGDLAGCGERLAALVSDLRLTLAPDAVSQVVNQMLVETKNLVKSGKNLQGRMTSSSQELENLRRKLERSKKEAETDALTGLLNRRGFEARLTREITKAQSATVTFSIIMLDLDHFKIVNDTHGHLVGDSILKALGIMLKKQLKGKDIPGRFGGEEFILLLPETGLQDACSVAENIRETLASREWRQKDSGKNMGRITLSLGVAQYRPNEPAKDLIDRADKALYLAKDKGRNRVASETSLS